MKRPSIGDYDCGSYLEPSIDRHDVKRIDAAGSLHCDGSPSGEHEALNLAPELCQAHAFELARTLGFTGPVQQSVTYQPGLPPETEDVMVLRNGDRIVAIASYAYGRCYFEPGDPRTVPCSVCGTETLIDAGGYTEA